MMLMNATYFVAATTPLTNANVGSDNVLFVPNWNGLDIAPKDVVCFVGSATALKKDITSKNGYGGMDCTAANGCGVHIHSGKGCEDTESQGGHWYNEQVLSIDPWTLVGYKATDSTGYGKYAACVRTGFDVASEPEKLLGHSFIVHDNDGSRVSCGLIELPVCFEPATLEAKTSPIPGTKVKASGKVSVMTPSDTVSDAVCYMGYAEGLEKNVESYLLGTGSPQCNVTNGCGAHIHSGDGCSDKSAQGGHYWDRTDVAVDPWKIESYYTTSSSGEAAMVGCTITGDTATEYKSRPFIVHETDGSRLLCGLLEEKDDKQSGSALQSITIAYASMIMVVLLSYTYS